MWRTDWIFARVAVTLLFCFFFVCCCFVCFALLFCYAFVWLFFSCLKTHWFVCCYLCVVVEDWDDNTVGVGGGGGGEWVGAYLHIFDVIGGRRGGGWEG